MNGKEFNLMLGNDGFIYEACERCGHSDVMLSELQLTCNYGSHYDGEQISLSICGKCADEIYNTIQMINIQTKEVKNYK